MLVYGLKTNAQFLWARAFVGIIFLASNGQAKSGHGYTRDHHYIALAQNGELFFAWRRTAYLGISPTHIDEIKLKKV